MSEDANSGADLPTLGVYLHVPFCERICPYCDFAVVAARPLQQGQEDRYVDALLGELAMHREDLAGSRLETLYLGGGTPSLLQPESIERLVSGVRAAAGSVGELEVTLELNPSTSKRDRLPAFGAAGVNRLSIGVQSFDAAKLRALGRAHGPAESTATLAAAREAGFDNVSIDLMFRAPGESMAAFERDLDCFAESGVTHVSAYELTIEEATAFGRAEREGRLPARASEDEAAGMIERIEHLLEARGFGRYELSAYAQPGFEAVHNQRYWERTPVLGLGVSAWSTCAPDPDAPHGRRRANVRSLGAYLECVENGRSPQAEHELLSAATARGEAVFLGLRRRAGVDAARFEREFGGSLRDFFAEAVDSLCSSGMICEGSNGDLALTPRGRLLADGVASAFV